MFIMVIWNNDVKGLLLSIEQSLALNGYTV